ncbi:hypothetical protein [Halogeometricum sp. CBA1124]|uniref:DUF7576 family protein n=1 Tax=Halogeometricum sp. CBA1124 TaxID=2668071 RepID=UPI00142BEB70|nr:hypothetical protein [Halogeometricum sp. CBA1124]MUV58477.1 hypothetical protein [Halogeometricum sp. CBA1124]
MTDSPDQEIADASQHPRDGTHLKRCATCAAEIDPSRRHLAATAPDDPSTVYLFCSEDCRVAWTDDAD